GGAPPFDHAQHHAVFTAHAPHDLPDRIEGAELACDIPLDILEYLQALGRVKTQRATLVVIRTDIRQLAAAIAEKLITDVVIPLDGSQHPNWRLRVNNTVRQAADNQLVLLALFYRHVGLPVICCCCLVLVAGPCRETLIWLVRGVARSGTTQSRHAVNTSMYLPRVPYRPNPTSPTHQPSLIRFPCTEPPQ